MERFKIYLINLTEVKIEEMTDEVMVFIYRQTTIKINENDILSE